MLTRCGIEKSVPVRAASYVAPARPPGDDAPLVAKLARGARGAAKSVSARQSAVPKGPAVKFHVVIGERMPAGGAKADAAPAAGARAKATAGKAGLSLSERRARVRRFQQRAFVLLGREVNGKLTVTALQPH
jgi:hypothetical protein